jgi:hypothetical protein
MYCRGVELNFGGMNFEYLFLGAFAKERKPTISFVVFVRPHGAIRLSLHKF